MLEVFYEQLNFEMLIESSAYGVTNMMADFGGQLGLWLGSPPFPSLRLPSPLLLLALSLAG